MKSTLDEVKWKQHLAYWDETQKHQLQKTYANVIVWHEVFTSVSIKTSRLLNAVRSNF